MYQDNAFGKDVAEAMVAQPDAMGLEAVATTLHKGTDIDFKAQVAKQKEAAVILATAVPDSKLIIQTMRRMA